MVGTCTQPLSDHPCQEADQDFHRVLSLATIHCSEYVAKSHECEYHLSFQGTF
jgi:hypothetical protein